MPRTLSVLPLGKLIILAFYLTYFAPRKPKPFTKSKKAKCEGRNGTQWGTVWYKSKQVWDKAEASSLQRRLSVGFYYPQVVNTRWHRGAKEKVITLTFGIKSLHIFIFFFRQFLIISSLPHLPPLSASLQYIVSLDSDSSPEVHQLLLKANKRAKRHLRRERGITRITRLRVLISDGCYHRNLAMHSH